MMPRLTSRLTVLNCRSTRAPVRSDSACTTSGPCRCPCSLDRKSTRPNSSHQIISYAVFCLKKKNPVRKVGTTTGDLPPSLRVSQRSALHHQNLACGANVQQFDRVLSHFTLWATLEGSQ